ncbi:MAG TPA: TIGR03621 family F420-dependent LLM class oxidoreductase [Acidimicrobiales bacterium]|nr:TIGR03621 family F420-dependent LLM class oxidoreductase [Acidimicrobiales bacterium]
MTKPFRFAVQTAFAPDGKSWRERARQVEALGYSTLYIPDHFGEQFGPLVALTAAAEATERLNVGALVLDNDYRHPLVLAKELATLDLFCEGRLEAGLGAGWMKTDYDESGMPYDSPGTRIDRMVEGLAVMKGLWSQPTFSFSGEHYTITNAQGLPRPYSQPHPKIVIGGGGKKVLSIAAREADIVGVNPNLKSGYVGPETAASALADRYRERIGWVREAAGDRIDDIELQVLTFLVQIGVDPNEAAANIAPLFGIEPEAALEIPLALVGSVDTICETLQRRREEYGLSYVVVHEAEMEAFGEVVARLAGT